MLSKVFFREKSQKLVPDRLEKNGTQGYFSTVESYNASAVKIYLAMSSLVRFETKNIFFYFEKNVLACYNAGVVVVNS
jgi:hypothetical protein